MARRQLRLESAYNGNQVNPPHSHKHATGQSLAAASNRQSNITPETEAETALRSRVLLLDLSGDTNASARWAESQFAQADITPINKADFKWASKREALAPARQSSPEV